MNDYLDVREQISQACRHLAAEGLTIGGAGNVSVRVGDHVVVTATEARFADMTPEQVVVVDLEGKQILGDLEPTSEIALHLGVYNRYAANSVVHTHAPVATAVSTVTEELPCVHYYMLKLGGALRVAPYHTWGTPELAEHVLTALEGKTAALMANHGAVNFADSLENAVEGALLLEWLCTVYWRAASMGSPRSLTEPEQQAVVMAALERMDPAAREALLAAAASAGLVAS